MAISWTALRQALREAPEHDPTPLSRQFPLSGRGHTLPPLQRFLAQPLQRSGPGLSCLHGSDAWLD